MTQAIFDSLYKKLNNKQREAVDTIEGPVMVVAGPGTGKTTILTLRIANILRITDTPPSGILAITFTDAGVKAMRRKLKDVIGSRAHEVRIHTFHNFAASIIAEFKDHFVHLDRVTQLTDVEAENMIRDILRVQSMSDLRPFANPDFYIQKIMSAISDAKREAYSPEKIREFVKSEVRRVKSDDDSYSTRGKTKGELKAEIKKFIEKCERTEIFANVYEEYEVKKRSLKKMDFDDLIGELLQALKNDELLLRMLQEKFLYILVDEHQDTNNSQNELIKILADFFEVPNVFIVGDEKQAIYRFQGASVENFLTFQKTWGAMKIINLEDNYRSHQSILDASFEMIEKNYSEGEYEHLRIRLKAGGGEKIRPVEIVAGEDTEASLKFMTEEIKRVLEKDTTSTIALITKTNRDLERVLRVCEENDIAVSSERSIDIFSHPLGALFFDLAEFLHDITKLELLSRTLISGLWNLSFEGTITLIKNIRSGKVVAIDEELPVLKTVSKELNSDNPLGFLIHLAEITGLEKIIAREASYVEVWRGIVALSENIIRTGSIHEPRELLSRLVAYRASSNMRSVKISIGTPDLRVRAMTAHGSKGLEFDYVFIPYTTEESWIGRNWGSYFVLPLMRASNDIKDIRRLFYVALTRARKHVTVLYGNEEYGELLTPLRFIDELLQSEVTHVDVPRSEKAKGTTEQKVYSESSHNKFISHAKRTLLDSGLSVTALNHFLKCPSMFLFVSILKLPQAPAPNAEKGNAMHDAFRRIWATQIRTEESISTLLSESITSYFETSFLPVFEKEAVKEELLQDAPIVARALVPHFNQEGTIFSESWSETEIKVKREHEEITLPIHGKLDVIVDTGKQSLVFDYKTKQAMSENEIRGNTKNSNGDYFRQLVFYRMLLENDSRFSKKEIIPSLFFVSPDSKGNCHNIALTIEKTDIEKVHQEIGALLESVWSGKLLTDYCEDEKCEWCRLKKIAAE